jgi:hypothetical protein
LAIVDCQLHWRLSIALAIVDCTGDCRLHWAIVDCQLHWRLSTVLAIAPVLNQPAIINPVVNHQSNRQWSIVNPIVNGQSSIQSSIPIPQCNRQSAVVSPQSSSSPPGRRVAWPLDDRSPRDRDAPASRDGSDLDG